MIELELKYRLQDDAGAQAWLQRTHIGPFALTPFIRQQVIDTYLDTATDAVARAGYALRFREKGDKAMLQLKSLTPAASAIHRRQEMHINTQEPTRPRRWPDSDAARFLRQIIGDEPLQLRFMLEQQRHQATLHRADSPALAELSLDDVRWRAGGREARAWELELELLPGNKEEVLLTLAALLRDEPGLQPQPTSKYERGITLLATAD